MTSAIRRVAKMLVAAAIVTVVGATSAQAAFESGPWKGNAYARQDGVFERCVITTDHPNAMRLGFAISAGGVFEIWLMNKGWALQPGQPQQVTLWVDNGGKRTGNFENVSSEAMAAQFVSDQQLVDALKRGNVLHVTTPTGSYDFKLTGTFKAIGELEKCWAQSTGRAPAASAGRPVTGMDLLSLPPREFAGRVITSQRDSFFKIADENPEAMRRWNAALIWMMEGGLGMASGESTNPTLAALRDNLAQQKQQSCKGEFSASANTVDMAGVAVQVKRVEVRCSDIGDGTSVTEVFSFYPHLSGQLLVILHVANDPAVAVRADAEFVKRARAILLAR
jgi:hypothetical protein